MLSIAAAAFAVSAVSFATERAYAWFALGSAALSAALAVAALGVAPGLTVALALWLTAASVLVLVLAPRPTLARPIGVSCSLLGMLALAIGALS